MDMLTVDSPAFRHGDTIPSRYTCDGPNVNPPLRISQIPAATRTLALIMEDPDAPSGTWVHWVVWNIPPQLNQIPENGLPAQALQGRNSWRHMRYDGPCPPSGTHRYLFRAVALDSVLHLSRDADRADLEQAMQGHILARGEVMGTYRSRR